MQQRQPAQARFLLNFSSGEVSSPKGALSLHHTRGTTVSHPLKPPLTGEAMSPRDDDKGNYDDTEFPPDSENSDNARHPSDGRDRDTHDRVTAADEGDYDDKDQ
jgi:hypothetical protein